MSQKEKTPKIEFNPQGKPIGWFCNIYNTFNDILDVHCAYCKYCKRPEILDDVALVTSIRRTGLITMESDKDLYIKLFAQEKRFIADMDMPTLRARKEELRKIILEAKIRSAAVDETERERKSKLTAEQKEWLISSGNDPNITDAIESVEKRKKRMSKSEKMNKDLSSLLGDDIASELMKKVEKAQTSDSVNSSTSRNLTNKPTRTEADEITKHCAANRHADCNGKFTDGTNRICDCSCHNQKVQTQTQTQTQIQKPNQNSGFSFNFGK